MEKNPGLRREVEDAVYTLHQGAWGEYVRH
jgi:hypothetical protein